MTFLSFFTALKPIRIPKISVEDWLIILKRLPFLFATMTSLVPLFTLSNFSKTWTQSTALTIVYSSVFVVEMGLLVARKEITKTELIVYSIMVTTCFILSTIYTYDRYSTGNDTKLEFIISILGYVLAIVSTFYQLIVDRKRNLAPANSSNA